MEELKYTGEKFSIYWDSQEEILFVDMWGEHKKEDAEEYKAKFEEFANKIPSGKPIQILVDVSKQTKSDNEARKIYTEVSKRPRSGNSAICGANIMVRVIAAFIATATNRKNIKVFAKKEEGLKWLKEIKTK
jgi:hypothetical protein